MEIFYDFIRRTLPSISFLPRFLVIAPAYPMEIQASKRSLIQIPRIFRRCVSVKWSKRLDECGTVRIIVMNRRKWFTLD